MCTNNHQEEAAGTCCALRDEMLFKQPESGFLGDCPICCLPLSFDMKENMLQTCCSKVICNGCSHANMVREIKENRQQLKCPFCRHAKPTTQEEMKLNEMKRVAANDPVALRECGKEFYQNGDYESAFKYCTKAAELGDVDAHYHVAFMYRKGQGVEKDEEKYIHYLEEAAIGGHPRARCNLAFHESKNGRFERAVKHLIIAANLGYDDAIQDLKDCYKNGLVSKDDFAAALRANQAVINETKSPQREAAKKFF
eukprot:scaffold5063_cov150-Skeletonema_menzelii.AAC.8